MSRKTRKLMWSVPLIAAVAVIGALAVYVMLAPGGALAHSGDSVSTAHQPPGPVTRIDVTTPSIADGGRTMLRVSWNAPTGVDMPTMYRVDISKDTDVWMNVIGGEMSDDMLTDADAMADCTSDDNRNRCYTAPGLDSDTLYHFRVFAMNEFGTSPISVDETLGSGMTLRIDPPARVGSLDATDYYEDKIVVSWHDVLETGGGDVLWYCIGVTSSPFGAFTDLTLAAEAEHCLEAEEPTDAAMADDDGVYMSPVNVSILIDAVANNEQSQTIVVAAKDEDGDAVDAYEHLGLHTPDVIELRYRLYAVTDGDDDPETVEDRRISRAASETATGRTIRPSDKPDPRFAAPPAVGNLRAVVYFEGTLATDGSLPDPTDSNQGLHFFWTHPDGYDPDYDDDETAAKVPNWNVQVQRRVAADADHDAYAGWQFVTGDVNPTDALAAGYGRAQFTVDFSATLNNNDPDPPTVWAAPVLWGDSKDNKHEYRVRYVNPGADDMPDTPAHDNDSLIDDVGGAWEEITIPQVTTNYLRNGVNHTTVPDDTSTLPIILLSATDNAEPNLRFEYNDDDPRDHIDLLWTRNANAREDEDGPHGPHGYVIDRSPDDGDTWETLLRADKPTELGTADTFTDGPSGDHDVVPGHQYTYRVFPAFIEDGPYAYGVPALIDANSQGAALPTAARSVSADADGQNACLVTWAPPADDGGHPVRGYLIEMAPDDDGNPGAWTTINVVDGTRPLTVMGGTMTEFKYTGTAAQVGTADELSAGSVRWFRVIPITDENDGVPTTGGAVLDEEGNLNEPRNGRGATVPLTDDVDRADPAKCTTEGLGDAPADMVTADPQMPVDLTAEAASDTNSLDPNDRGVFLTWNQQPKGDASKTTSYQINRIRMNTGVEALNDEADDWQFVKRVRDVTSYTDSTDLRRDEETRMYQVCSEASGVAEPVCVAMAVDYALHLPHMPDVPMDVMATAGYDSASDWWETLNCRQMVAAVDLDYDGDPNSETGMPGDDSPNADIYCAHYPGSAAVMGGATALTTEATAVVDMKFAEKYPNMGEASIITVTWDAPSDGGSPITGYMVQSKYGDMKWMDVDPAHMGTGAMYIDKNLMSATAYYYQVKAMNAKGDSAWSMMAMQTTENTDPMAEGAIEAVTLMAGDTSDAMDVSMYFSDADGDTLTYTAMSDMEMYATVAVDGSMVTIAGVSAGMATVTVTANDGKGGTAMQTIMVTVPNSAPMAEGSIEAVTLMAGDTSDAMDVSMYFSDADMSDTLTYTAMSDMEMYATVAVDGSMVTITGVSAGMATVTVTANDGKGGTAMQTIMVTVPNSAPMAEGSIEAVTLMAGDTSDAMDVSMYFSDADMSDTLTYTAMSDMEMYATVAVDGSMVTITGVSAGMATVTVTANDGKGGTAMQTIMVTVPNSAPMAEGSIEAVTLMAGDTSDAMDVSMYFSDADMSDTLTYTAMSDMEMYATVAVDGSMVTITGVSAGMATVTVTANDGKGGTAMQTIMVTVPNSAPMAEGSIEAVTLMAGDTSDAMDVSMYFSDADMSDTLTYTAMSDMEMYATVAVDGSMVTITGVSAGMATVTVTANDGKGGTAMQTIMVTVPNSAPMAEGSIEAVTLMAGDTSDAMDVSMYFSDADMSDTLTYTAMSDMEMYATVVVDGSMVTITGVAAGMATITVTATDEFDESAMQTIMVTVEAADTTLTAPSDVMVEIDDANPGSINLNVTWTSGANADGGHIVMLFRSNFSDVTHVDVPAQEEEGMHTLMSVAPGDYVVVVVSVKSRSEYLYDYATVSVGQ